MTMRAEHRRAAAGLLALASLLLVAGCGVPDPFASSGLGGKAITLDMPIVNGSHPFLIAHVRVAVDHQSRCWSTRGHPTARVRTGLPRSPGNRASLASSALV